MAGGAGGDDGTAVASGHWAGAAGDGVDAADADAAAAAAAAAAAGAGGGGVSVSDAAYWQKYRTQWTPDERMTLARLIEDRCAAGRTLTAAISEAAEALGRSVSSARNMWQWLRENQPELLSFRRRSGEDGPLSAVYADAIASSYAEPTHYGTASSGVEAGGDGAGGGDVHTYVEADPLAGGGEGVYYGGTTAYHAGLDDLPVDALPPE